jgi:hypothetical protein
LAAPIGPLQNHMGRRAGLAKPRRALDKVDRAARYQAAD